MKTIRLMLSLFIVLFLFTQCETKEDVKSSGMFTVTIENVMDEKLFFDAGVFNTPVGANEPGGAGPGSSYQFTFNAGLGTKLSFATMYVKSNDLFYAPADGGIELYVNNDPIGGDITSQIMLWDAGTEVNEEPGAGPNQPLIGGPDTGTDENGNVREIDMVNDGFTYPIVSENIMVSITNDGGTEFTLTIENLPGSTTPIAPGVWVIHTASGPLYASGMADYSDGLELLAEDGDPSTLGSYLESEAGYVSPLAPGGWAVHGQGIEPLFMDNITDYGVGLENLSEDGDPSLLGTALASNADVSSSGIFNTPTGAAGPGPLLPGNSYSFTFTASEGDYLSFASMLVHSNDLFYAPSSAGISLWNNSAFISGDITSVVYLWDAGTEVNEYPGAGIHQPARLNGGDPENDVVKQVNDGFTYPTVSEAIKVTIHSF